MAEDIPERDLRVETTSNISGASVRVTHLPTGTVGESEWCRSPLAAREQAMKALRAKMAGEGGPG